MRRKEPIQIGPVRTHAQKKPEELLSLNPVWNSRLRVPPISKGLPCQSAKTNKEAIFSNAYFTAKDHKACEATGKRDPFKRTK